MNWPETLLATASAILLTGSAATLGDPAVGDPVPASTGVISIQDEADPEAEPLVETFDMQTERYRRMTVPVSIGGNGPFAFMVDTGAQATVLSSDLAERLQLHDREAATLVGMASTRAVETTMVEGFNLGSRTFTVRTAPIVAGEHIGTADGILGLDSLQGQRVLIDFEHGLLTVADNFQSGGASGYDIVVRARSRLGQLIIHRAEVDGVRTAVIIDTGATGSIGNAALQRRLRNREELGDAVITDVNGHRLSSETRLARRLNMGRVELDNFPVSFADSPTFRYLGLVDEPAMILGMSELRLFRRIAIDFRSNRVLFDIPGTGSNDQSWNFNSRATRLRPTD